MDPSGDFEPLPSPLGQKLASVVPRKVTEEMGFWGNQKHFDTFTKKSKISKEFRLKLSEKPHKRDFVV